ncbi:DUF4062 domain-containing protein [Mitsuaria sp. GD03876]|uniref:DUF4062 domain-containing protein n=1 Tax=Mitsuaria sp. GD03876 TaxID=2975399 RepID=UPI00244A20D9|nr:DUF4062 domain-containing protein [Mitsuaria sp. GD03876]MDH0865149.1 DUF4062 domain-containing protein [Mitsuaria sp. GD03876]
MEKRYQVFVSSTFADLKDEREKVIQTLMQLDCIPSGMELFPAMDEEQFAFIRRVIDDCDYYLLIIGGRYGSLTSDGISYTEKEYDYAISKGMKVLALLHGSPGDIAAGKTDQDSALALKLVAFREKASTGRLVKYWKSANELPGIVALSLPQTIRTYPAVGWIRADRAASAEILSELNEARKRIQELTAQLGRESEQRHVDIPDLAGLDEEFSLEGRYTSDEFNNYVRTNWRTELTWLDIFAAVGPYLAQRPRADTVQDIIAKAAFSRSRLDGEAETLDDQIFQTISIQLRALGLIRVHPQKGGDEPIWEATEAGELLTIKSRVVRAK